MKRLICLILVSIATSAVAAPDPYQQLQGADMQQAMQNMMKMQQCMQQINQSELEALQNRGIALENEISALCKQGKNDEAKAKGLAYAQEMKNSSTIKQLQNCSEYAKDMIPEMQNIIDKHSEEDYANHDICTDFK